MDSITVICEPGGLDLSQQSRQILTVSKTTVTSQQSKNSQSCLLSTFETPRLSYTVFTSVNNYDAESYKTELNA
jgi:hypothetical protein